MADESAQFGHDLQVWSRFRRRWWLPLIAAVLIVVVTTWTRNWASRPERAFQVLFLGFRTWTVRRPLCVLDDWGITSRGTWRVRRFGTVAVPWEDVDGVAVVSQPFDPTRAEVVAVTSGTTVIELGALPRFASVLDALEREVGPSTPDVRVEVDAA